MPWEFFVARLAEHLKKSVPCFIRWTQQKNSISVPNMKDFSKTWLLNDRSEVDEEHPSFIENREVVYGVLLLSSPYIICTKSSTYG